MPQYDIITKYPKEEMKEKEGKEETPTYDDVLEQVTDEINISLRAIDTKRWIFRERLGKYIDQNIDDEKLSVNMLYAHMNLHLAVQYNDETSVIVEPRKIGDEELADNLTDLANYDYDEMQLSKIKFQQKWDEAFYGVSLRVREGQDEEKQVPIVCVYDPLTWLPDPYGDHITPFRYHYFECQMSEDSMTEEYGFDKEKVEQLKAGRSIQAGMTLHATDAAAALQRQQDTHENYYVGVYDGFSYIDGKLHHITVDTNCTTILRDIVIKPLKGEKVPPLGAFVNVTWFSPKRGDPFGVSLADLVVPKQKIESILMNLQVVNAKFGTFGQTNLVNTEIIKNTADLQRPSVNTRWIGVNAGNQNLSNAIYPVPRQQLSADAFNVVDTIKRQTQLETGMDDRTLGIQSSKTTTLGEAQQIQSNANLRFSLSTEISTWGEVEFWKHMWYRSYLEYFAKADKKIVRIATGFGSNIVEFKKEDFIGDIEPDIRIESKKKVMAMRETMAQKFMARLPLILQNPALPTITKTMAMRYALKLDGMSKEMREIMAPASFEELDARSKVILLNNNDMLGAEIDNIDVDHMTYLIIFESARDTPAKAKAIELRKRAIITQGLQKLSGANQQSMETAANVSTAQSTASALNAPKQIQSAASVAV